MYKEIALTSFKEEVIYRIEFIMSIIGSIVYIVVFWFFWNAIFKTYGAESLKGFTLPMMITYSSISAILVLYSRSFIEFSIEENVKTGFISVILTKPVNYPLYHLFRELGATLFKFLTRGIPIFLTAFFILNIFLPSSPIFFVSVFLGFFINFFIALITGFWSFWTSGSIWGIRFARQVIADILSGAIIPIFLFPAWLSNIAYALPFQATQSIPLLIYIGKINGLEIFNALLVQVFWIILLGGLSLVMWKSAEKKTLSYGG